MTGLLGLRRLGVGDKGRRQGKVFDPVGEPASRRMPPVGHENRAERDENVEPRDHPCRPSLSTSSKNPGDRKADQPHHHRQDLEQADQGHDIGNSTHRLPDAQTGQDDESSQACAYPLTGTHHLCLGPSLIIS